MVQNAQNSNASAAILIRETDPNVLQRRASNPDDSVWVGASAGSGKTKVLTDRILRLLLPNATGLTGTLPNKILALTFTKAAASEMALRISKRLSEWATMELEGDHNLRDSLKKLLGQGATPEQLDAARKLFAAVIDAPGGLKIMTIHSFCQSVLSRFPLEADLLPNFNALEESEAKILLQQAIEKTLDKAEIEKGSPLSEAIHHIAQIQNEDQFTNLLQSLMSEQRQMTMILERNFGIDGLYTALCNCFNIPVDQTKDKLLHQACDTNNFNETALRQACAALATGTPKTDQKNGLIIQEWLDSEKQVKTLLYKGYKSVFVTQKGTLQARLMTNKVEDKSPGTKHVLEQEAERVLNLENQLKSLDIITATRDIFCIGKEILNTYNNIKQQKSALDFDDLILRTLDLLQGKTANMNGLDVTPWVRFKMDQGIDHILVDEAQDTNPEQWEIIQALCDDFYNGENNHDSERTVFIVGDEKQSIFSFQRASPEKFYGMQKWFSDKIKNTGKTLTPINFITSFRSVPSVLQLVDTVFAADNVRQGLSDIPLTHESYRRTQTGLVELWPLFKSPEKQEYDPWAPPIEIIESNSGAAQMANHIGETIKKWIDTKEILESYSRPIQAGDIMILVRSRTAFIDQLVRALKTRNIPVSGVDRMVLSEQLVVQDLCALAQFALLPEDDLILATILKSPFIGWDEEELYNIAYKRQSSLWNSLKQANNTNNIVKWFSTLIDRSGKMRPYDFFMSILQESCPADDISGLRAIKKRLGEECLDPLNEFLNTALKYERQSIPTLQNFVQTQLYDDSQIKRQMEEANNAVRIMTVHGAKGLQAPIVILPDTTRTSSSNKSDRILWPDRSGVEYPLFCPTSDNLPPLCQQAKEKLKELADEEYRRLLYVALTRAEDRLYIGGYKATKPIIEESWYRYVEKGFENLPDVQQITFNEGAILRFVNHATDKPDHCEDAMNEQAPEIKVPAWLFKPMPEEPFPPRPLVPSRPSTPDVPALSPLQTTQNDRFKRGNITHKLLQILPNVHIDRRQKNAEKYVAQSAHNLSKNVQQSIVSEVMKILNHPDFAPIFGKNSIAEAPVTGLLNGNILVSGQIDRLLVSDDEILIIDYKSNRPPPTDVKDVPRIYFNQMKAYADLMRSIYPNRTIKTALIWTDGCRLMELPTT
jgi:ATP-dependent helicase/nuclease subunit A